MQWEAVVNKTEEVFHKKIPIFFLPLGKLTPEEEATRDQQGPYDRMVVTDLDRGLYGGLNGGQDDCELEAPNVDSPSVSAQPFLYVRRVYTRLPHLDSKLVALKCQRSKRRACVIKKRARA